MTKHIRLLDHNVEKAYGLSVTKGRFKNSVRLALDGTIGDFTVDAQALLAAVQAIAGCEVAKQATKVTPAKPSAAPLKATREQIKRQPRLRLMHLKSNPRPSRPSKDLALTQRQTGDWSAYEDRILREYSALTAAKKLGRPLGDVLDRMSELGF